MASTSDLARLYEATFGTPPSTASTAALLRMEELLGLTQDDPLARMLIVQLRVADQVRDSLRERTTAEQALVKDLRELGNEFDGLIGKVRRASSKGIRIARSATWTDGMGEPIEIDVYRRPAPILSYLAYAFRARNGILEHDERVAAARISVGFLGAISTLLLLVGMVIGRYHI